LGAEKFLAADGKLKKVARKRVGFMGMKAPAREGAEIFVGGEKVGCCQCLIFTATTFLFLQPPDSPLLTALLSFFLPFRWVW
jgi:hypothetical protein